MLATQIVGLDISVQVMQIRIRYIRDRFHLPVRDKT